MKIKKISDTDYIVYLFNIKIDNNDIYDKVKEVIKNIKKVLRINGFYKVLVYTSKVGMFIKLIKLDDSFYKNTLDLKIELVDDDIYIKTNDYFVIKKLSKIVYFDGEYYGLLDDSFDKIFEKVEFCEFMLASEIDEVLKVGLIV